MTSSVGVSQLVVPASVPDTLPHPGGRNISANHTTILPPCNQTTGPHVMESCISLGLLNILHTAPIDMSALVLKVVVCQLPWISFRRTNLRIYTCTALFAASNAEFSNVFWELTKVLNPGNWIYKQIFNLLSPQAFWITQCSAKMLLFVLSTLQLTKFKFVQVSFKFLDRLSQKSSFRKPETKQ